MTEPKFLLSFSRPWNSNDSACNESIFRTLKNHYSYLNARFNYIFLTGDWVEWAFKKLATFMDCEIV